MKNDFLSKLFSYFFVINIKHKRKRNGNKRNGNKWNEEDFNSR